MNERSRTSVPRGRLIAVGLARPALAGFERAFGECRGARLGDHVLQALLGKCVLLAAFLREAFAEFFEGCIGNLDALDLAGGLHLEREFRAQDGLQLPDLAFERLGHLSRGGTRVILERHERRRLDFHGQSLDPLRDVGVAGLGNAFDRPGVSCALGSFLLSVLAHQLDGHHRRLVGRVFENVALPELPAQDFLATSVGKTAALITNTKRQQSSDAASGAK